MLYMLNDVLRLLRISKDWTIKELSQQMKVSSSYLSEIERGVKKPTLEMLDKYSEVMGVDRSTILYFEEEGSRNNYGYQELLLKMLDRIVNG